MCMICYMKKLILGLGSLLIATTAGALDNGDSRDSTDDSGVKGGMLQYQKEQVKEWETGWWKIYQQQYHIVLGIWVGEAHFTKNEIASKTVNSNDYSQLSESVPANTAMTPIRFTCEITSRNGGPSPDGIQSRKRIECTYILYFWQNAFDEWSWTFLPGTPGAFSERPL